MKTTVEIPKELFRQAKIKAASEGITLRELIEQGLRLALQSQSEPVKRADFPLIRANKTSLPLTDEQINQALADMDEEQARAYANPG
jgi:L-asparaginase II